ncbi:MAG: serpin family protein [Lachnospiraceae bacterium]|nr:serpin family protein [Lachnospiraceae bacterium]
MKKKLKRIVSVMVLSSIMLTSFGHAEVVSAKNKGSKNITSSIKTEVKSGRKMTSKERKSLAKSSFKMLSKVIEKDGGKKNVLIAPTSVMYAFGMAENGAKGKSRSQLEKVVNGGVKTKDFNEILASMRKRMNKSKDVSWNVANSVWYKNDKRVKVKKSFLKKVKGYYGGEVYRAPFNADTAGDVNSWVNKNTKKMIPKIMERCGDDDVMYIINAMAFDGKWMEPFEDDRIKKETDFTNIDKSTSKVTMLTESQGAYFELNGAYGFKKYYKGGEYSFVGIDVPDGKTPAEYVKELSSNGGEFVKALDNMKSGKVYVEFPEFKLDYDVNLTEVMKELGAKNVFDKNKANLYNMFEKEKDSNYYFSAVLHKTHIEVDSKGTKAAAVTAIIVNKTTSVRPTEEKPVYIVLDHPFVYAIVDNKTNLPVFVGCINTME